MITESNRTQLELEFMLMCRERGPDWIASVIRPLRLKNDFVTVKDIPANALRKIVHLFGSVRNPVPGIAVL
jgi:hypothetical protein